MRAGNWKDGIRAGQKNRPASDTDNFPFIPNTNEDVQICRVYDDKLEYEYGIKFAPEELAYRFSYEHSTPPFPTFGFHELKNLGRHCNMEELQNAEELMKQVFGGDIDMNQPTMVMFSMESLNQMPDRSSGVIVEELNNLDNENKTTESKW